MKKGIILLLILTGFLSINAQNNLPRADLLDINFSPTIENVKDNSPKNFSIQNYGSIPLIYDANIKQYISRFPQNTTTGNYYRIDYMNDTDFKNKIQSSFTIEVYIKAESSKSMSPVSSMELGGFGIQQKEKSSTQFFFGKSSGDYHSIGSKNIYGSIKSDYHHIVYTYDGNNLKAYYDGINTDNLSNVGKLRLSSTTAAHWLAIGGDVSKNAMQREFIGDIALVKMYSSALSASDIGNLYAQISKRKALSNVDNLNVLLTKTLANYPNKAQAAPYLEEGWILMNSLGTTEADINTFQLKVQRELSLALPTVSEYPRFAVMSDIHVGRTGWKNRLPNAVEVLKEKELDAVFVVGDVADNGRKDQLQNALSTFSPLSPETSTYFMMGNHDWWEGNGSTFKGVIGQKLNQFIEIKGYPFITVSLDGSEKDNHAYIYQSTSKNFLKAALEKANSEYPGKPIFVFMHVPMTHTVYGSYRIEPGTESRANNTEAMKEICKKYPQIVLFSGHSHYPIGDERCIHQKYFTAIHDGNLTATNIEDGLLPTNSDRHFSESLNIAEGCIVSVNGNKDVIVDRIDFTRNELIKKPWTIKAPHDGSMFTYFRERDGGEVPYFAATDKLTIDEIKSNSFKVTFPQAKDDDLVHHYLVELMNKRGEREQKVNVFSQFFFGSATPKTLSLTMKNLKGIYSDYMVKVTAIDSFYPNNLDHSSNKSEPLTGSAKDAEYNEMYLVGSAAPCGWSNTNPEAMTKQENGVFVWTGFLKKGEFKFLLQKNTWDPSVNPTSTQNIESGNVYNVNITNAISGDYKFNTVKDMHCSVFIDTKNWTVNVVENKEDTPLYLVGDATPNGWYNTRATPMIKESAGVFTWSGYLKAGHFKFITQLGTWNSIVPSVKAHETIIPEYKHSISENYQGDYRFVLLDAGNYTIRVNLNNNTMFVDKDNNDANIYIIGDATPTGWYNTRATPLSKLQDRVYQWQGTLKAGHFKFITRLGTWDSLVPVPTRNETVSIGTTHQVTNNYRGDYRFVLSEKNDYIVTLDLDNRTFTVRYASPNLKDINEKETPQYTIISGNSSINIVSEVLFDTVHLWDISGKLIAKEKNKSGTISIDNLKKGIYIIELTYKGEKVTRKILID
ncbi:MAG: SusF/SusE family outer membrane protein [Dysgonomonas sp.]